MQKVTAAKKMQNGVVVIWETGGGKKSDLFSWEELVDMKVNALDLLQNPEFYGVDATTRTVIATY